MLRTILNLRATRTFPDNRGVGCREHCHRTWEFNFLSVLHSLYHILVTLDAVVFGTKENAETLRLVWAFVGSMNSLHKIPVIWHDEVVFPLLSRG